MPLLKTTVLKVITTNNDLQRILFQMRSAGKTIGLVPTMGALHNGHLSLLAIAKTTTDIVVSTIFVNPTQFNDPADLEKYPRPIESDIEKLTQAGCDMLFAPSVKEMYGSNETWRLDIGRLETILEGKFRPGHYQGVTQIVYKLFDMVKPDTAFFGQKDYQQFLVISKMVQLLHVPVKLIMCPIIRDSGGLAMSSRNVHLTENEKKQALVISQALMLVKQQFAFQTVDQLKTLATSIINKEPDVTLEYFEIADRETLEPAGRDSVKIVALVAAKVGHTRLIDNIILA